MFCDNYTSFQCSSYNQLQGISRLPNACFPSNSIPKWFTKRKRDISLTLLKHFIQSIIRPSRQSMYLEIPLLTTHYFSGYSLLLNSVYWLAFINILDLNFRHLSRWFFLLKLKISQSNRENGIGINHVNWVTTPHTKKIANDHNGKLHEILNISWFL